MNLFIEIFGKLSIQLIQWVGFSVLIGLIPLLGFHLQIQEGKLDTVTAFLNFAAGDGELLLLTSAISGEILGELIMGEQKHSPIALKGLAGGLALVILTLSIFIFPNYKDIPNTSDDFLNFAVMLFVGAILTGGMTKSLVVYSSEIQKLQEASERDSSSTVDTNGDSLDT